MAQEVSRVELAGAVATLGALMGQAQAAARLLSDQPTHNAMCHSDQPVLEVLEGIDFADVADALAVVLTVLDTAMGEKVAPGAAPE